MSHGRRRAGAYALVVVLVAGLGLVVPVGAGAAAQPGGLGGAAPDTTRSIEETELGWEARFFGPGLDTGTSATGGGGASALAVWDDGTGPALYAGGETLTAGRHEVSRIARWDGHEWSPLTGPAGTGVWMAGSGNPSIKALAVYDGALIAAGFFDRSGGVAANNIARWDGTQWAPLGAGVTGGIGIESLTVHDGALYAAGSFTAAGGEPANRVARWDGEQWTPLAGGMPSGSVYALASYGGDLYAGGSFTEAGGVATSRIARWDGSGWSAIGAGVNNFVRAFTVHDGRLVVGGAFTSAGDLAASRIAGWDGAQWSTLGAGMSGGRGPTVFGLGGYDGALVAAGAFQEAGGVTVSYIARWDGTQWSALGTGMDNGVSAVVEYDGALIAGSAAFREAGGVVVNYIARWDGDGWSALDGGPATGLAGPGSSFPAVDAMTIWNGELVVAGVFSSAGGQRVNRIARWDGATWAPLAGSFGAGMNGSVWALAVYRGDLIVGGSFSAVGGGLRIENLARYDGDEWSPVAAPGAAGGTDFSVQALAVHDGELVVGGGFTSVDGVPVSGIARWDGTRWSGLGTGMNSTVYALTVHDGDLLAGGGFTQAGGVAANRVARWDGAGWSPVGGGVNGGVFTLAVHDSLLYAGGEFTQAGGATVNRIARWDGAGWSPVGGGTDRRVGSLASYRGELYVGGDFTQAGGAPVNRVARWDSGQWSPLTGEFADGVGGAGTIASVRSLLAYDADGAGPVPEKLAVGGRFQLAGGVANWGLAMYGPTAPLTHLTVSPGEAGFPPVPTGETSGPLTVTLTGSGNQPVEVSALPAPEAPFRATGGDCPDAPFTLAPTESCTLGYEFTPPAAGEYAQTLPVGNSGTAATLTLTGTGLAGPPGIAVDPAELALELPAGETGGVPVSIDNHGEAELSWQVLDGGIQTGRFQGGGVQAGGIRGGGVQADGNEPARAAAGTAPPVAAEEYEVDAADGTVLTHSESMEVQPGHAITCSNTATGHSRGSQFLRTFRLSDFDIDDDFLVTDVTFGVQRVRPDLDVTVNLYTMDGSLRYQDLDLLASQSVTVQPEQNGRLVTVPVRTVVPAGSTLVVELATADLLGTGWFYPGANDRGETAPSYFASEACGYPEPTSMASVGFGFPDVHLAMAVTGRDPVDCQRPEWLDVSPASGATAGGGSSEVTVSFDASGLAPGEYAAVLCVASDDPASTLVTVPVSMSVVSGGGCDETITGVHAGALTVTEGVTCLAAGAQVLGEVNVSEGAGLVATAAVVQGPVSAVGAGTVELVFSQVTGPVLVTGATGSVSLFGSQVTGSVTLLSNATPTAATVSGNTIIGSLSCFGNQPAPTDHGLPNTATGGKLGQCAAL